MNEQIRLLAQQAGTDTSGKWMSVDNLEEFTRLVVGELRLNGYDDAAETMVAAYQLTGE